MLRERNKENVVVSERNEPIERRRSKQEHFPVRDRNPVLDDSSSLPINIIREKPGGYRLSPFQPAEAVSGSAGERRRSK